MPEYQLKLPVFEGPFDLLLHLIRENQVDIYDIPIAEITAQYLDYLQAMEEMDLEIASSFLVMAATLLAIKAKLLLPVPPAPDEDAPEEDARGELVRDLLEYIRFKQAAGSLELLAGQQRQRIARPNEQEMFSRLFSVEHPLDGKTLADIQAAFARLLQKAEARGRSLDIERERITLREQLERLYGLVAARPRGVAFSAAFELEQGRMALIVAFLALLELARQGVIRISQGGPYDEIYLYAGDLTKYEREAILE